MSPSENIEKNNCMICISTRQNTTNFVPFQQVGCTSMVLFETEHAEKQGWGKRLKETVEKYDGKDVQLKSLGIGTDLHIMVDRIQEETAHLENAVWNIGGGQKMQQLALISVFLQRKSTGKDDWACYADPGTKKIYKIRGSDNSLLSKEEPLGTRIHLDEILSIFGLAKRESNTPRLLWSADGTNVAGDKPKKKIPDLFYDRMTRHEILRWELSDKSGPRPHILEGLKHDYADFFEQVVQFEITEILRKKTPFHHISEAWANIRVKNNKTEIAEWDVVLVTDFGTLLILDAKTGFFSAKDESARLHNLEKATGAYGEFWLVVPYINEDMAKGGFYDCYGTDGKGIKKIPFELNKLQSKLFAVTGDPEPLFLKMGNKEKIALVNEAEWEKNKDNRKFLRLPNLQAFLKETKLEKIIVS